MPNNHLPALAAALALLTTAPAYAMGGGGVGAGGGGGFGLPLWQPPGVAREYYGPPPADSGYALRRHVRRAYGHVGRHHHYQHHPD